MLNFRLVKLLAIGLLVFVFMIPAHPLLAQTPKVEQIANSLDLSDLNQFLQTLDQDTQKFLPSLNPKTWGFIGPEWDYVKVGRGIVNYLLRELVFNSKLLGELLLLAMALAILQNLQHAFESDTVGQLAFGICFLVIMGIVIHSFQVTFKIAQAALSEMVNFMYAITPLIFSLIAAGGGVTTATIVHPLLISSVGLVSGTVSNIIFPLIMVAGLLGMVNYLAEGFQVMKLAHIFKSAAIGMIGLVMALFIGFITIQGFAASVADSMALRTAKYVSNTFLPVVGGALSDTMEMAASCSMVLKSGLGIYGLGLIVLITVFPLAKILSLAAIYHLTAAIIQPLGNNRLADALQTVGGTFLNLFGAVAVVGLMFFISISILVGISGMGIR